MPWLEWPDLSQALGLPKNKNRKTKINQQLIDGQMAKTEKQNRIQVNLTMQFVITETGKHERRLCCVCKSLSRRDGLSPATTLGRLRLSDKKSRRQRLWTLGCHKPATRSWMCTEPETVRRLHHGCAQSPRRSANRMRGRAKSLRLSADFIMDVHRARHVPPFA